MSGKSFVAKLAAETLLSDRATYTVIELTCDLVIADARFNSWCVDLKVKGDASASDSGVDWMALLDRQTSIEDELALASKEFLATEWPRGAPDVWHQAASDFAAALRAATQRIDDLGRESGRTNQRLG